MIAVVDTSIWVAAFVPTEPDHAKASLFLDDVFRSGHRCVQPTTVYVEIAAALARRSQQMGYGVTEIESFLSSLRGTPNIRWLGLDQAVAIESALVAVSHSLRGMDAIIAATAILYDLPLLTEDRDFQRVAGVITVLSLKDI